MNISVPNTGTVRGRHGLWYLCNSSLTERQVQLSPAIDSESSGPPGIVRLPRARARLGTPKMGSSQSARKLTISNEEEIGVIEVSNALVSRLAQRKKAETSEPSADAGPSASIPTRPATPAPLPNAKAGAPKTSDAPSDYSVYYYPQLTVSAHQMEQQMEQKLKQQEGYWWKRLQNLEQNYEKINRILEDEHRNATANTKTGQRVADIQGTMQPCLENSNKVLKCFQDHPKETLKCSSLVEEFSNCVWNVHYTRVIESRS